MLKTTCTVLAQLSRETRYAIYEAAAADAIYNVSAIVVAQGMYAGGAYSFVRVLTSEAGAEQALWINSVRDKLAEEHNAETKPGQRHSAVCEHVT